MWVSSKQTVFQQPTTHINMYNKNCMYPFVNCMYCKFPRINDSWFLRQNGRHFPDDIFKCIFSNEKVCISIKISLKFSHSSNKHYSSIGSDNGLAPTRRQAIIWTNERLFTDAFMRHHLASMSQYHHKIGSMTHLPLFRIMSWNKCMRCIPFYIHIQILVPCQLLRVQNTYSVI